MKIRGIFAFLATMAVALGLVIPAQGAYADEGLVRMKAEKDAYQINRHDAKDRFCYDGSCVLRGTGEIEIMLNPEKNTGRIEAFFSGPDGEWRIVQTRFRKIATDVALHGATGGDIDPDLSPPVLPEVWTYVATWGPAEAYHNGRLAWKGPTHLMVTEEVRDPATGRVDFKGPMKVREYPGGIFNKRGVQVHYVTHPDEEPVKGYLPPYTKFVHLMWDAIVWE